MVNAKWVMFLVFFYVMSATLGAVVDGVVKNAKDSVLSEIVNGSWSDRLWGIYHALSFDYDWMSGTWEYFKLLMFLPAVIFGIFVALEVANYWRGRG